MDHALDNYFNTIGFVGFGIRFCRCSDGQFDSHFARGRGRCADLAVGQRTAHLIFGF